MPRVFISHSTLDRRFVEQEIIQLLEKNHVQTWYARNDIQTAAAWERTILEGLERCEWFLVVLSPRSEASEWVKNEVFWAMEQRRGRIIPVLLEKCNAYRFHLGMPQIQRVDFSSNVEEARQRLLKLLEQVHNVVFDLQHERERASHVSGGSTLQDLYETVQQLKRRYNLPASTVSDRTAAVVIRETERGQVEGLVERLRQLPPRTRSQTPALLNSLGQLQLAAGLAEGAANAFDEAASAVGQPTAAAEAHHNAYQAAIALRDWSRALASLQQAVTLDGDRWALFAANRYEPQEILGAGGFGVAFLCKHRYLGSQVVVKALSGGEPEKLFTEARMLDDLDHPAIVHVRDGDFADAGRERPFLVLDHFAGLSLDRHVVENGPLNLADLLTIACQVGEALQHAHARGILHRDVKPANLLLRRDDVGWRVKLIDFGLAVRPGRARSQEEIAGTLDYAPPEQLGRLADVPVGPYSDVYGFAKLCCFALFETPHPQRKHWRQVPEALADLLERCQAELPAERPQHFGEVLPELFQIKQNLESPRQIEEERNRQLSAPPDLLKDLTRAAEPLTGSLSELAGEVLKSFQSGKEQERRQELEQLAQEAPQEILKDVQRLIAQLGTERQMLSQAQSISVRNAAMSQLVQDYLARCQAIPTEQRRQMPDLLGAVGKLQTLTGNFDAARQAFQEQAALSTDAGSRAEAHFNAYRAGLERSDWAPALRELRQALQLDPGRFAPFPLDRYDPLEILDCGAYGVTFLCQHRLVNRKMLIKSLDATAGSQEVDRVFQDARLLAQVKHDAVLPILVCAYADTGKKTRPYLVLDHFEGQTLATHVQQRGTLSPNELLDVAVPAAEALDACHKVGLLHRFLTPASLLLHRLVTGCQVKLTDFGLHWLRSVNLVFQTITRTTGFLTGVGIGGNVAYYLAPEAMRGERPEVAGDVYSFAKVCCFALFGTAEPTRRHWASVPDSLADLLDQCLSARPAQRPATFAAVAVRLRTAV